MGPVGPYVEVVDVDPASNYVYRPVDLNGAYLLAQDGEEPSEGNPKFHQQMVYAVTMLTIHNFERALGRRILWAARERTIRGRTVREYVARLRIYPHALREANAYYSPAKKALLFGYFPADISDPGMHLPGGMVFTCLSHDVIAHETTHALLDGIHPRFIDNTNPDVLAFHEAFADLVALFQHFSMREVLVHQIARTRGDLNTRNLLGALASQFGRATGLRGALRDAIGYVDPKKDEWRRHIPDPTEYMTVKEPHKRGALLVAAIFDAFIAIYEKRGADLIRLASGGTGILEQGALHPDLVDRLADEAAKTAKHILVICVRALDYCCPIDINFGEYLRALITADRDLVPDDEIGYRIALIEAFRRRGIYPRNVRTLSEASLRWHPATAKQQNCLAKLIPPADELQSIVSQWDYMSDREHIYDYAEKLKQQLQELILERIGKAPRSSELKSACKNMGIDLQLRNRKRKLGEVEVQSLRVARRLAPDGQSITELIATIVQRRPMRFGDGDPECLKTWNDKDEANADAWFYGGCTLLIDIATGQVRYCVGKYINSKTRWSRQLKFQKNAIASSMGAMYYGRRSVNAGDEPFAAMHRFGDQEYDYE